MKNIGIIGADGFIGKNLLFELKKNSNFNIVTFKGYKKNSKNFSYLIKEFFKNNPVGFDIIYYLASSTNPASSYNNPIFEIEFPNASGTLASEINYRLADPQRSQLQAISLLSQGIFINEVSVSMQGITNNLYQKASDIVADLIGEKDNDKLKVGIDYLQGDKSALIDIATEDRLGFTLSTKISEKILLNGKIGVPVGGLEQTLIVGNVQIDFILNEEGSLKAKIFNKENEFRYIGDELGYTQGLGLSYDVDFNTFKQLINKIRSQSNYSKNENEVKQDSASEFINFIKKN